VPTLDLGDDLDIQGGALEPLGLIETGLGGLRSVALLAAPDFFHQIFATRDLIGLRVGRDVRKTATS